AGRGVGWREVARWGARPLAALVAPWRRLAAAGAWRGGAAAESAVLVALLAVLAFYFVLALFTLPLNYDSNTYRLSRVALWLQEGHLYHFATNDDRQNWIGQNADLVMLWLTGLFRRGYPLVKLAQWGGGVLACLAVVQLGAWLGLARVWRLGAALVLVGIPTVATQFISSQTDLFTAGCLVAGLAFLPAALAGPRRPEWLLVGLGGGLALGAKATVFYWAPGLAVLLAGWAWLARAAPREVVRGALVAALVALPLCSFNFALNAIDLASPVAPPRALKAQAQIERVGAPASTLAGGVGAIAWQLFEPHSNPLLPAAVVQPVFRGLLDWLAEHRWSFRGLRRELAAQGGWRTRGLNEDEASFGVVPAAAALLGALLAFVAWARGARDGGKLAVLALALAGFVVFYAWSTNVGVNQYRYFCLAAPFTALLAVAPFARRPSRWAAAAGALLLVAQAATAVYVGVASRNQGLAVLLDPSASRWHRHWLETRRLAELLGTRPLRIGVAIDKDSWQAPLMRTGVAHRWLPVNKWQVRAHRSLDRLLASARLDALVGDPYLLQHLAQANVVARHVESEIQVRRSLYRPPAPGERLGPRVLFTEGVYQDRWTGARAAIWLTGWDSGSYEIELANPTALARQVEASSGRESRTFALAPGATVRHAVAVRAQDVVVLQITPPYLPAEHGFVTDGRRLGLLLGPWDGVTADAVYADGWTAARAAYRLADWTAGSFALELANAAPFARTLRVASSRDHGRWELAAGETRRVAVAVAPGDTVAIDVEPPFVPRREGLGDDPRELGLMVRRAGAPDF
ncbi:MAG: hypothetical protein NDJ75_03360, partial [Thermoanaerobaculia bacterium]|nr:hypothetical protein [Thermoanaerobaculia bacterium]